MGRERGCRRVLPKDEGAALGRPQARFCPACVRAWARPSCAAPAMLRAPPEGPHRACCSTLCTRHAAPRCSGLLPGADSHGSVVASVTSSTHERKSKTNIVIKHNRMLLKHNAFT